MSLAGAVCRPSHMLPITPAMTSTRHSGERVDDVSSDKLESLPLGDGSGTWGERTDTLLTDVRANAGDGDRPFSPAWSRRKQAEMLGVGRHAREWVECTVLLTPTASTTYPETEDPIPPVIHYEHLAASAQARRQALSRALDGVTQWRAVRVVGSTETGHVAPHTAVYLSESVQVSRFEPWLQSHLNNCELATEAAHGPGAVRIEPNPSTQSETGVIGYLIHNVPALDTRGDREHGLDDEPRHRARTSAVVEAVGVDPVRLGRTAS